MFYIPAAAIAFAMVLGSSSAHTQQDLRQSLKPAVQTANRPNGCNRLAPYFEDRLAHFRELSEEHEKTLRQELEHPALGAKYPTAVDRARRMQEYYLEQSRKAQRQGEHCKSVASQGPAEREAE